MKLAALIGAVLFLFIRGGDLGKGITIGAIVAIWLVI